MSDPTPQRPLYRAIPQPEPAAAQFYMITCDEGWRWSVVCTDMYEWSANWLVEILQGRPFAPSHSLASIAERDALAAQVINAPAQVILLERRQGAVRDAVLDYLGGVALGTGKAMTEHVRAIYAEHGDDEETVTCPTTGKTLGNIATIDGRWVCCGGLYPDHAEHGDEERGDG